MTITGSPSPTPESRFPTSISRGLVHIVIPDDFPPAYSGRPEVDDLRRLGEVAVHTTKAGGRDELMARLSEAHVVLNVRSYTSFDAATLEALPQLALIAVFGTGTDNIDLDAAARLGIAVVNAPGANARSVAEHAVALALAVARAIPHHDRDVRAGRWVHHEGPEFEGKTFGVVGLGNIGRHTARIASAFGMRVLAWSLTRDDARARDCGAEPAELDDLLRRSDVVSLHVAATERTRRMVGARELGMLKPGAILVNTARGALVDEAALVEALRANQIFGAGLDVFVDEPLPAGHPLTLLDNVVLTPHAGWVTREARERLLRLPVENIAAYLSGAPQNVVNPASLARARPLGQG
jgi:phosphoglycerate dehydrogenase-like enzyme